MKFLAALAAALVLKLLVTEAGGWSRRLQDWLVVIAVGRVPMRHRERLSEEWRALLADYDDRPVSKIAIALGFVFAACKIDHAQRFPDTTFSAAVLVRLLDIAVAVWIIAVAAPAIPVVYCALRIRAGNHRRVLDRCLYIGRNFEPIYTYTVPIDSNWGYIARAAGLLMETVLVGIQLLRGNFSVIGPHLYAQSLLVNSKPSLDTGFTRSDLNTLLSTAREQDDKELLELGEELMELERLRPGIHSHLQKGLKYDVTPWSWIQFFTRANLEVIKRLKRPREPRLHKHE